MFVGISKFCRGICGEPLDLGLHCKGYTDYPYPPICFYFILYLFLYMIHFVSYPHKYFNSIIVMYATIYLLVCLFSHSFILYCF